MTGVEAPTGLDMLRGARLATAQLNAGGGVLGRRVELVAGDDRADPATGAKVARRLVRSGVSAVIGPFNSAVGLQTLPIYRAAGLPILRLTSATATEGFGVTTQPMVTQIAPVEQAELTSVLHARSVAVLYDPSTYTAAIASQLAAALRSGGVSVPIDAVLDPLAGEAQTAQVLQATAAARPDVTYLAMYGPQAGAVAARMAGAPHSYGRCFVDLAAQGPSFVTAAGAAASGCLSSGVPSDDQLPGGKSYTRAYRRRFHSSPGTWGAFTYDSLDMLAAAVRRSRRWTGPKLRNALAHTRGFRGVTGETTVQPASGNRADPPVVILDINPAGRYVVNAAWASFAGYL
ncbi:MAG: branched-chain amino acid transport system substrate-binding protein [Solirubrobacteraceae bacterium]|nr:branched-chain amino acid transport system substrate-binding protein [Solirubrobacteraceae bacterium]